MPVIDPKEKVLITPVFRLHVQPNEAETKKQGRPIYDEKEVVDLHFAGLRQMFTFPAHEIEPNATRETGMPTSYAMVYNKQYLQFKDQAQQTVAGTPLSEAPFLTQGKRLELRACSVHTVEALAALDGPGLARLGMGGRQWKDQAAAYLKNASGSANVTAMAAELAALRAQLAAQRDEFAAQMRAMNPQAAGLATVSDLNDDDAEAADAPKEKTLENCTDAELRAYIKRETGKGLPGFQSRAKLLELAMEIATNPAKAAA